VTVVFWELKHKHPVVQLHLFADRSFAAATALIFAVGFALYGSTVLLPIFCQTLLGYDAMTSGLVLSPGGLITMVTMPIVGILVARMQPRFLVVIGFVIGAISLFMMANFNLSVDYSHAVWARNIQSASLGFLFIPINVIAYYGLPKQKYDQAAGIINLARNLGGSFGISFVTTILARRAQFHQNVLSSHLNEYSITYQQTFAQIKAALIHQGSSAYDAGIQAKAFIYQGLLRQANMLAFIDNFWLLGVLFLAMIPLVFLLRKNRPATDHDGPGAH
jgi:DHA2 family multidrug resistance protein